MAYSGGEVSSPNQNDEQIAKDLRLKLKQCAEKFKKCIEELDEQVEKDLDSKMKQYEEKFKKCLEALDEVIVQDLISNLEQYDERFEKFTQELDEAQDDEAIRSAMGKSEKLTHEIAEWAKEITKPQLRAAVIKVFKKEKGASNDSLFSAIEMMIESFKHYVKDRNNAGTENCDEEMEGTLNKLLARLSEVAQQIGSPPCGYRKSQRQRGAPKYLDDYAA